MIGIFNDGESKTEHTIQIHTNRHSCYGCPDSDNSD